VASKQQQTGHGPPPQGGSSTAPATHSRESLALAHALAPGAPKVGGIVWAFFSNLFTQLLSSVGPGTLGTMLGTVARPYFRQAPSALQEFVTAFSLAVEAKD